MPVHSPNLGKERCKKSLLYSIQVIKNTFHVLEIRLYELENSNDMVNNLHFVTDKMRLSATCDRSS